MTQHHDDGNKTLQTPKYSVLCLICHTMPNEIENKLNKMISFLIEKNNFLHITISNTDEIEEYKDQVKDFEFNGKACTKLRLM